MIWSTLFARLIKMLLTSFHWFAVVLNTGICVYMNPFGNLCRIPFGIRESIRLIAVDLPVPAVPTSDIFCTELLIGGVVDSTAQDPGRMP